MTPANYLELFITMFVVIFSCFTAAGLAALILIGITKIIDHISYRK